MAKRVIHWFRRDLRITDNSALVAASKAADEVVPVYILSDWKKQHHWTGPGRQEFLCDCLDSLSKNLNAIGSRLIIRKGNAMEALKRLIRESKAEAIYCNRDPDPFGKETEKKVAEVCREFGIDFFTFKDCVLHEPSEILTGKGTPYRVYTPYSKAWFDQKKPSVLPRVKDLGSTAETENLKSLGPPGIGHWKLSERIEMIPPAGEKAAMNRLKSAMKSGVITAYAEQRNLPATDGTSQVGPDLRYGTISPRQIFAATEKLLARTGNHSQRESIFTFQKQLAWREFFIAVLGYFPEVLETEFNSRWRNMEWDDPAENNKFEKWQLGETGFPIVDAGMRQLAAAGYMHNRVRMITAMFLTKDLHIHWRIGEAHFLRHLLDGEIASNNGGWQWSSGTGADAAPYFRIQNPWTQTERYDPDGIYIKKWIPELSEVDPKKFRKPAAPGTPLSPEYPLPIVDHAVERERTLERFNAHRKNG